MNLRRQMLVAYGLLILVATGMPGDGRIALATGWDKVAHGLMFFVLGVLSSWTVPKKHVTVITGALIFACATELMQLVVPGRGFEAMDLVADAMGVVLGWGAYQIMLLEKFTDG